MILFLTLIYVALLFALVKVGVIKWNMFWKTSPALWMVLLLVFLFIPMQWGAPQGDINMYQEILEVIPNVSGEVAEVSAKPLTPMKKGDPIFKIDPTTFQSTVSNIEAQLSLARLRYKQSSTLASKSAGSQYDVEQFEATIQQLEAQLEAAKWNLQETIVRAPSDGYVIALALQKGQRVANMPIRSWVSFVKENRRPIIWVPQTYLRHVEPGQEVEVSWKLQPGKIHKGTVLEIAKAIGQGQWLPSGIAPTAPHPNFPGHFPVIVKLDETDSSQTGSIYGGAYGVASIYTKSAGFSHAIRRIILRMNSWMNYIIPY